jgi:hypothetical protein
VVVFTNFRNFELLHLTKVQVFVFIICYDVKATNNLYLTLDKKNVYYIRIKCNQSLQSYGIMSWLELQISSNKENAYPVK